MEFLRNAAISLLMFATSLISGTLGFLHISQPQAIPATSLKATTTQAAEGDAQPATQAMPPISALGSQALTQSAATTSSNANTAVKVTLPSTPHYQIVGNEVHWVDPHNSFVGDVNLTQEYGADPQSFRVLDPNTKWQGSHTGMYGSDKQTVYFQYQNIPGADPMTFSIITSEYALAKDKGHVYIQAQSYPELDPRTLNFLGADGDIFYFTSGGKIFSFNQGLDLLRKLEP